MDYFNVPLLSAGTGTMTTKLLGLHPSGVSDQQSSVIRHQLFLQLHGAVGVNILGIVCNKGLCNGLADGVDLRSVSSTFYAYTDVKGSEGVFASNQHGLINLQAENFRLDEVDGGPVNADKSTSFPCMRDSGRGLPALH